MPEHTQLAVFYDGHCPLCVKEMHALKQKDLQALVQLEAIHACDFNQRYPPLDPLEAKKIMQGLTALGDVQTGRQGLATGESSLAGVDTLAPDSTDC